MTKSNIKSTRSTGKFLYMEVTRSTKLVGPATNLAWLPQSATDHVLLPYSSILSCHLAKHREMRE
jgi:hypothetical protein